jgi:hypothetical protein
MRSSAMMLMAVYVLITFVIQFVFFMVSQFIDHVAPDWSLIVFLCLFMCAYGFAWPLAVRVTEPKPVEA